eukprot:jgi/Chlat1/844/Chrsp104S01290
MRLLARPWKDKSVQLDLHSTPVMQSAIDCCQGMCLGQSPGLAEQGSQSVLWPHQQSAHH